MYRPRRKTKTRIVCDPHGDDEEMQVGEGVGVGVDMGMVIVVVVVGVGVTPRCLYVDSARDVAPALDVTLHPAKGRANHRHHHRHRSRSTQSTL